MSVTVAGVIAGLAAAGVPKDLSIEQILPLVMASVVFGGLFQILFGILRLGKYITLVPYSVVSGFMSGIGVIIIALQIGPLLGIITRGGVVDSLSTVVSNFQPNGSAIAVAIMTLGIVFLTPRRISQWVPSPLLALLIVTPLSILFFGDTNLDRIGDIPRGIPSLSIPSFTQYFPIILKAGLVLAVLGAIDSLLTSLVADNISQTRHNSDRELIGQGIGNAVAGIFTGLPGAGAVSYTHLTLPTKRIV